MTPDPDARRLSDELRQRFMSVAAFRERYDGWDVVGTGGFGAVVRTVCRPLDLELALKLWVSLDDADAGLRQFREEWQHLARVLHPNVVRVFSAFTHADLTWMEMEYVAGSTLADALRQRLHQPRGWPLAQVLHIGAAVAEGLAAVHAAGVVHRDVTPNNILLPRSRRPAAKLADFGIATLGHRTRPRARTFMGAPPYVAPEVFDGQPASAASDVYALCVTLYQVLAGGRYPYRLPANPTLGALARAHARAEFVPLMRVAPRLPAAVVDVIEAGLAKAPQRRPSAKTIASVLVGTLAEVVQRDADR